MFEAFVGGHIAHGLQSSQHTFLTRGRQPQPLCRCRTRREVKWGTTSSTSRASSAGLLVCAVEAGSPVQVRCRHILLASEEMAMACKSQIEAGDDFGEIARTISTCDTKQFDGHLGWVQRSKMVSEFEEAVFNPGTPLHELIVVNSPFGWHVIEAMDRDMSSPPRTVSASEFHQLYSSPETRSRLQLVDVRDMDEVAKAKLDGFISLPMSEFPSWTKDVIAGRRLDLDAETILLCHTGNRSRHMCDYLAQLGMRRPRSLEGGIDGYAEDIDPTIPRYAAKSK